MATDDKPDPKTDPDDDPDDDPKDDPDDDVVEDLAHWKAMSRKNERELKRTQRELERTRKAGQTDDERKLSEAREEAKTEALKTANERLVRAAVKEGATGRLANPKLALRLLDLDEFEVDDDGDVDDKAIAKAIDELLEDTPELAAKTGRRGSADAGTRGGAPKTKDMNEIIRDRMARR